MHKRRVYSILLGLAVVISMGVVGDLLAENIDPLADGSQYAYGENTGWINFQPVFGSGVTVSSGGLTGLAWSENFGWLNLSPVFGGVINDGTGVLSGFAWAENGGWMNFAPIGGGVVIDQCGDFSGRAWGENVGWITFQSNAATPYKVSTSWVPLVDTFLPVTAVTAPSAAWRNVDVSVVLLSADNACGSGVKEIHHTLDANPVIITPGSGLSTTISSDGVHLFSFFSVDHSGNFEASQSRTFKIDKTPPIIEMITPSQGASFFLNSLVIAKYGASDPLSGVSNIIGSVQNGKKIKTNVVGPKSFVVKATDKAGNTQKTTLNYSIIFPGNIDPGNIGGQYAWAENGGWTNFQPIFGPGVTVTDTAVTGKAWSENFGWLNLNPATGGGVQNDGAGHLSGKAWSENAGWINFSPTHGGVSINPATGEFSGDAWGENIGWIRFRSTGAIPYGVTTAWRGVDTDGDGIPDSLDNCTTVANADQRDTNSDGFGNICDPDLTNDGFVNFGDLAALKSVFGTANANADFNGDGFANFGDLALLKSFFGGPPGPSGVAP